MCALRPLKELAERTGVAVLVIRHMNKAQGGPVVYRGGGSIGIIGAARIGLVVGLDPDDETEGRHVLALAKKNLTPDLPSLAYRIKDQDGVALLEWEGAVDITARQVVAGPQEDESEEARTLIQQAMDAFAVVLAHGPVEAQAARREVRVATGASDRTIDTAKTRLGIQAVKEGFGKDGRWLWALPLRTQAEPKERSPAGYAFLAENLRSLGDERPENQELCPSHGIPNDEVGSCPACRMEAEQ